MNDPKNFPFSDLLDKEPPEFGRPHMSQQDRAAQFAPFAALTGYDAAIRETGRQTEDFAELDPSRVEELDLQLQRIEAGLPEGPVVTVTYFKPDARKEGGAYCTVTGTVKKIDKIDNNLVMSNDVVIDLDKIASILFENDRRMEF